MFSGKVKYDEGKVVNQDVFKEHSVANLQPKINWILVQSRYIWKQDATGLNRVYDGKGGS